MPNENRTELHLTHELKGNSKNYRRSIPVNDVMDISAEDTVRFPLEMRPFRLHSMIKEASCLAKCLCVYKGFDFELDVQSSLPDLVIGDERRAFQVIIHMVGYVLNIFDGGGNVIFRVFSESDSEGKSDRMLGMWKTNAPDEFVSVRFDMEMREGSSLSDGASSTPNYSGRRRNSAEAKEGLGFIMCKRLVQVRHQFFLFLCHYCCIIVQ
ncbi:hypothetical protein OIU78_022303 [Salix suchowensis]|nr:hypothetical protein OIU78_022303 [Salix suchowensis]